MIFLEPWTSYVSCPVEACKLAPSVITPLNLNVWHFFGFSDCFQIVVKSSCQSLWSFYCQVAFQKNYPLALPTVMFASGAVLCQLICIIRKWVFDPFSSGPVTVGTSFRTNTNKSLKNSSGRGSAVPCGSSLWILTAQGVLSPFYFLFPSAVFLPPGCKTCFPSCSYAFVLLVLSLLINEYNWPLLSLLYQPQQFVFM